ncbi:TOMM precursor leader peptide-binding protein [Streptomyces tendae]|uniref:TOMM precursor leader peptide-binding protein n=1 Tax=Streptomyces tendae TaxID=1932 RepID=UPI00371865E6
MNSAGGREEAPRYDDGGRHEEERRPQDGDEARHPHRVPSRLIGLKTHLRPSVVPGEAVYLVSQRGITALLGPLAETLVPLLDGSRSADTVVREAARALGGPGPAREALAVMENAGLLRTRAVAAATRPHQAGTGSAAASEAYWDLAGLDGGRATDDVAGARVRIVVLGTDPAAEDALRAACAQSLITVAGPAEPADFALVLCDDYLTPALRDVDSLHRAHGVPWLPIRTAGPDPWVGPVFRPGDGPCWSCLATRLSGHRSSEEPLRRHLGLTGPLARPPATLHACTALAAQLAVLETAKWLAGVREAGQSAVHTLDTLALGMRSHPVARRPQCPVCGDPELTSRRVTAPFVAVPRPKADVDLGGHRALTPARMLERYGGLVDPVTGIIKEISRAPHSPDFVQAFLSGPNLAMGSRSLTGLRTGLRALSGGKGLTEDEARVSALCEAVERYSGTRQGDEPVVRDSYRGIGPRTAVHPAACQLYDERQLRERGRWNASGSRLQYVPEPFDEDRVTEWTPVWSLTAGTHRLLPTSMLYFSESAAPDGLWTDSNGNAAGASPEDALIQGFLELVERDAVALWWYNRTRQPGVDLDAVDEPYVARLREGYARLGREVWALDLTSDFGIPVVAALSRRTEGPTEDIVFGFGAHFDPKIALRRALTEMGQLMPAVSRSGGEGSGYRVTDPDPVNWWRRATVGNQPYLLRNPAIRSRTPQDWGYVPRADLLDDVHAVTALVRERGMELLVLDQTRSDVQLPVVKVVVPGMRHFWPRFAPGRLYDVPVALGRCPEPTGYERLNPIPVFV